MKTCRAVLKHTNDACGKPAMYVVTFSGDDDSDKAHVCEECMVALKQTAEKHSTIIRVDRVDQ